MEKFLRTSRIVFVLLLIAALLVICATTLYKLQIIEGEKYADNTAGTIVSTAEIQAARGSILDRNGKILASGKATYNVKISRSLLLKEAAPNDTVERLIKLAIEYGVEYRDTFPITLSGPFDYSADMTEDQTSRLKAYFEYFKFDDDMSASDLLAWMREHYGISYTLTSEEVRRIIGVRYELEIQAIAGVEEYIFAENVSLDFITALAAQNFTSVRVTAGYERTYHTPYAAHLLGYTGLLSPEEYEEYKDQGYSLDSYIGKAGVESAFENYLHGTNGSVTTYYDTSGAVTNVVTNSEPKAGENVYLTIDIDLQAVAENSLASTIAAINAERKEDEEEATGGAAVVLKVNGAETLVLASYPSYDISTFRQHWTELINDPTHPFLNRATDGVYNPGSTFKMITAFAGLETQNISMYTTVHDEIKFTKYPDFQPRCWSSVSHGNLNVVGALENSCNYFFYWLGDTIGADAIAKTAADFGLGAKTGIEIGETEGTIASVENKKKLLNEDWWAADNLLAAIGQGLNYYTPIQIADYVSTIANDGTRYNTTILKQVAEYDYSDIVYKQYPRVAAQVSEYAEFMPVIQSGMRAVAKTGTASSIFKDYPVTIAAKTGTVQSDTATINDGLFVCYAPADDPEIAIAVVVEKGGSGSAIMSVAKDILDAYFEGSNAETSEVVPDNSIIR